MKRSPRESEESAKKITRRGLLLGGSQLAIAGVLGLRMRYLQVDQADQYRLLAEENRINIRLIAPARGLIHDRNGALLAANEQNYKVVLVREDAGDVENVLRRLARLIPLSDADIQTALTEIMRRSPFVPVTIADRLSWDDIAAVAVNAPALPGVTTEVGLSRGYPMGPDLAHVVGYVGPVSGYDLERLEDQDPLLQIPNFQIGKSGVEAKLEQRFRGKAGSRRIEVNATGRVMRELDRREGEPGQNIQLTIDADLQNFVQVRLGNESASAVVMDTETGDLLAASSSPSFDPNLFVRGISSSDYSTLTEDKYRPLAGKAVQGTYPPGSTVKMPAALAALEADAITPEETVYCRGYIEVSGRRFHCWKRSGHGNMNMHDAIAQSCDVYFYDIAQRIGIDKISEMAVRLGLGMKHDLPVSAVAHGRAPTKAWKKERFGQEWVIGDSLNAAIGQGYVLASPLQLAIMTARLASGRALLPRLIKSVDGREEPIVDGAPMDLNENDLRLVRQAMTSVSNTRRGTGYGARVIDEDYRLAGKSGTSQVRTITMEERAQGVIREEDLPWERRDHALYVSYAPADNPKIAVSVVVEHGGGGSKVAAPIARDIALQALYGGFPPLSAYPAKDRDRIEQMQRELPLRSPPSSDETGNGRA